ncbi:3-phosphoshikimate 1-carboxyvinyltransferase [Hydromonas duriensis]|uniref:3-phosphoshikimate 1-carboxyvinyltransferase n=1 Tax=Hydromonas duriensis TaxID=1527608 RepID=A0A4V3DK33_9BURK|nr:3-phosphoshikimate 1-carboxyvinyltransferase [Hydromonas duriensis]
MTENVERYKLEHITLPPATAARGDIKLPGSKSISNRVLLLAALSKKGEVTRVRDVLDSDDTRVMLDALNVLGVQVKQIAEHDYDVTGTGGDFPNKNADLFMGNAGTAIRPLTAVLALQKGTYHLHGVPRMHERPIGDLIDALQQIGVQVEYKGHAGYPPFVLSPAQLPDGDLSLSIKGNVSSQFLTAVLMAAPLLNRRVTIHVVGELISKPYIEITLNLMARFGVQVTRDGWSSFTIEAGAAYGSPKDIYVEGDASSASYFLALGALGGGPLRVTGVGLSSIQGDVKFANALQLMGANVMMGENWIEVRGIENGQLRGIELDCNHIPDAAMTLATAALFAQGTTKLTNIASWRVKETDRLSAMATELRKVGATVEEGADYIVITPPAADGWRHAHIDTYDDHRMAMCFSLVALSAVGVTINDPKCVGKTFPTYFEVLSGLLS